MTEIIVKPERTDQPDVEALIRFSDQIASALYPDGDRQPFSAKSLFSPDIVTLLARTADGQAAGCCLLHLKADNTGELKRMIVYPHFRKLGVGKTLVASVCDVAMARKIKSIQLEVGIKNVAGQSVYQNAGFQKRGPFGDHKASPESYFMELKVDCG